MNGTKEQELGLLTIKDRDLILYLEKQARQSFLLVATGMGLVVGFLTLAVLAVTVGNHSRATYYLVICMFPIFIGVNLILESLRYKRIHLLVKKLLGPFQENARAGR